MRRVLFVLAFALPLLAAPKYDVRRHYQKSEYDVPMRDGVRLHTTIYAPRKTSEKLPFLLVRTPYGTGSLWARRVSREPWSFAPFVRIRRRRIPLRVTRMCAGKFKSEGSFTVMRPHNPNKHGKDTDESSDTYDTIDWLLKNIPNNNGRVGSSGHLVSGLSNRARDDRRASGAEGILAAGFAVGHVPRRRLPSQRRFPPGLYVRVAGRQRARPQRTVGDRSRAVRSRDAATATVSSSRWARFRT